VDAAADSLNNKTSTKAPVKQTGTDTLKGAEQQTDTIRKGSAGELWKQLVAKNFTIDPAPPTPHTLLAAAFDSYQKGRYSVAGREYAEALRVIETLSVRGPENKNEEEEKKQLLLYAHYYNAMSNMATGNAAVAIRELKAIKGTPDKVWSIKINWYLALAYLQTGQVKTAGVLLQHISDTSQSFDYRKKAADLLKEIKGNQE